MTSSLTVGLATLRLHQQILMQIQLSVFVIIFIFSEILNSEKMMTASTRMYLFYNGVRKVNS